MKRKRTPWLRTTLIGLALVLVFGVINFSSIPVTQAQGGGNLNYGDNATGTISAQTPLAMYTFLGNVGDMVEIDVMHMGDGLRPSVDLAAPDQQLLASSQRDRLAVDSQNAHIAAVLTQAGVHTLTVAGRDGTVGNFALRLNGRSTLQDTVLPFGTPVDVNIVQNAPPQYFMFEAEDCPTTLTVTDLADGQPFTFPFVAKVRNEDGEAIALLRGGDAQEDRVTVPALSGTYAVEVFADDPALTGMVSLLVSCAEASPDCPPVASAGATGEAGDAGAPVAVCLPCPECIPGPGDSVECPAMNLRITGDRVSWDPVPDADSYRVHMFVLAGSEVGYHLGTSQLEPAVTSYNLATLGIPDHAGFRIVVEAMQGGEVICADEISVTLECPDDLGLMGTIIDARARSIEWTWDNPGFGDLYGQAVAIHSDGSEIVIDSLGVWDAFEVETWITIGSPAPTVRAHIAGNLSGLICEDWAEVEFEAPPNVPQIPPEMMCPEMEVTLLAGRTAPTVSWNPVADAELYQIHVYVAVDGEERYGGRITVGAETTSFSLDVVDIPPDHDWIRVVVEAQQGAEVICVDEASTEPACPDMNFTASGFMPDAPGVYGVNLSWDPVPGTDHYEIHTYVAGEGGASLGTTSLSGDVTTHVFDRLSMDYPELRWVIDAVGPDGAILCSDEVAVALRQTECPDMNFTANEIKPPVPDVYAVTLTWNAVPGTDHYVIHMYELAEEVIYAGAINVAGDATSYTFDHLPPEYSAFQWVIEAVGADGAVLCSDEVSIAFGQAECPDMEFAAVVVDPSVRSTTLSWNPVPGTDYYTIHMYELAEEVMYAGAFNVPGDASSYTFDHLPPDFPAFTWVIEAIGADGTVLCSDETTMQYGQQGPAQFVPSCENFTATVELVDPDNLGVTLSWTEVPGTFLYFHNLYAVRDDGTEELTILTTGFGPEVSSLLFYIPLDMVMTDVWRFEVLAKTEDGTVLCVTDVILTLDGLEETDPACEAFSAWISEDTGTSVTFEWSDYPGAERYVVYVVTEGGDLVEAFPIYAESPWSTSSFEPLGPGSYTFGVGAWFTETGAICHQHIPFVLGGETAPAAAPCLIRTQRTDVPVHVGPGRYRSVFTYLPANQDFTVLGQAADSEGNLWWQIDKLQIPGGAAANSLWVAQDDVTSSGDCPSVPTVEASPIIPGEATHEETGTWGECGSCSNCGPYSASECMLSPTGECVWNPAVCRYVPEEGPPPGDETGDGGGPQQACYSLNTALSGPYSGMGSISVLTPTNCTQAKAPSTNAMVSAIGKDEKTSYLCSAVVPVSSPLSLLQPGGYLPGTMVTVQYVPPTYPSCYAQSWSGCGASGSGNMISFTMNSNCTITAYVWCP